MHVVWLKRDLRIRDHRPLIEAARRGLCVILYIYEPEVIHAPDYDACHLAFVNQSLEALDAALATCNAWITYRVGDAVDVLETFRTAGMTHLWSHEETGTLRG